VRFFRAQNADFTEELRALSQTPLAGFKGVVSRQERGREERRGQARRESEGRL